MKKTVALILVLIILLTTFLIPVNAEDGTLTVANAEVLSTECGYDNCLIYVKDGVALMSSADISRYTRAYITCDDSQVKINLGSRNIVVDISSGMLTEDTVSAKIKVVNHNGNILLHAYPILSYLGATCGVENNRLIINMPKVTMWEGLVRLGEENTLQTSAFGDETEQEVRLLLNGIMSILDNGILKTLLDSSLEDAVVFSLQINAMNFDSALEIKAQNDAENDALLDTMIAANDFASDFSDVFSEGESLTKSLVMDYFGYAVKNTDLEADFKAGKDIFKGINIANTFLYNFSENMKYSDDTVEMVRAFCDYTPAFSEYYHLSQSLRDKTVNKLSATVEAAKETAKYALIDHLKEKLSKGVADGTVTIIKESTLSMLSIWEKSVDISVFLFKLCYGENNPFAYSEAETACINLLRLKEDLISTITELGETIKAEKYSDMQHIDDYRLLNIFYYRLLIAANLKFKEMIIADKREVELADTIRLLDENNNLFAQNLYKLSVSTGEAFLDISALAKNNTWDTYKALKDNAVAPTTVNDLAMYYLSVQSGSYTINNGYKYHTIQFESGDMEPAGGLYKENLVTREKVLLKEDTLARRINVVEDNVFYTKYGSGAGDMGVYMIAADGSYKEIYNDFIGGLAADSEYVYFATDGFYSNDGSAAIYRVNYLKNDFSKEKITDIGPTIGDLNIAGNKLVYSEIPTMVDTNKNVVIYDIASKTKEIIPNMDMFEDVWVHGNYIYILKWSGGEQLSGQGYKDNLDFLNRSLYRYNMTNSKMEKCDLPQADYEELFSGFCIGDIYSNILDDFEKELPNDFAGSQKYVFVTV